MMDDIGVIHGRFQVLHIDHMKYITDGKKLCKHLLIGICNPDANMTGYTATNPHRSLKSSNPMTFFERFECIRDAMVSYGVNLSDFDIIPFPIDFPHLILNYAPSYATFYTTIFDDWGREKYDILKNQLNLNVRIIRNVPLEEKGISSSTIRYFISEGAEWKHLVPESVYNYIVQRGIDKRISDYLKEELLN